MRKSAKRTTPSRVLTAAQRRELTTLAALPDDKIDYSDIPPLTDDGYQTRLNALLRSAMMRDIKKST
jgi:hypothetical protein